MKQAISTQVIYKINNLVNDKFYVGSTNNTKERFRNHRKLLRGNRHHCKHLQAAWNKYGESKFSFDVVQYVPEGESLFTAEDKWLEEHYGKDYCYNSGRRADAPMRGLPKEQHPAFGVPKTPEHKEAISETLKAYYAESPENHPMYGRRHTAEAKAKMSASRMGHDLNKGEKHYRYGKTLSDEVKTKIGNTQRGKQKGPRTFTPDGLRRAQENMKRNAQVQLPAAFTDVHAKFPQEVKDKYDFQNAVYTQALIRIEGVVCHKHGVFSQYAAQFRKGRGCPACGAEARAISKSAQMKAAWKDESYRANTIAQQNVGKKKK